MTVIGPSFVVLRAMLGNEEEEGEGEDEDREESRLALRFSLWTRCQVE